MSQGDLFATEIRWIVVEHEGGTPAVMLTRPDDMTFCMVGDVIQTEPDHRLGSVFGIVTAIDAVGIEFLPPTSPIPWRALHGHYWRIGKACWKLP